MSLCESYPPADKGLGDKILLALRDEAGPVTGARLGHWALEPAEGEDSGVWGRA